MSNGPVRRQKATRTPNRPILQGLIVLGILIPLVIGAIPLGRWGLWAYNVEMAGRLMDDGLTWPSPRPVDAMPVATDPMALDAALGHLAAAVAWRPDHFYAHRLAGQIYMARQDWLSAIDAQTRSRRADPKNPLHHWEAALVYEAMLTETLDAPATALHSAMLFGQRTAPEYPIDTPFCDESGPGSCFVGVTVVTQPVAGITQTLTYQADTLFMHPPAQLEQSVFLSLEDPALRFLIGINPGLHDLTNGAGFHIWVGPSVDELEEVYARTLDWQEVQAGWHAGWVDLSQWAGQQVTIRLATDAGRFNDSSGDWAGWGDLAITTRQAAQLSVEMPYLQMQQAWIDAGLTKWYFTNRAEEARAANQADAAENWWRRTALMIE